MRIAIIFVVLLWSAVAQAQFTCNMSVDQNGNVTGTCNPVITPPPVPAVTGLSQSSGPLTGGETVIITGTGFTGATGVSFGGMPATSFTVVDATHISAVVPPDTAGTVDVTVTNASGTSATSTNDQFVFNTTPPPPTNESPGPSQALFSAPWYTCVRNFYVAPTGNDGNAGTQTAPWLTIGNADTTARIAGDCINVAPGTYNNGVLIQHGGNAPTATGYVVYRCQVMDQCHVLAPVGSGHLWGFANSGDFVVVDGFEVDGNNAAKAGGVADACFATDDFTYGRGNTSLQAGASAHHIWLINNIIHHCNLAGVSLSGKEWYYTIHNRIFNDSWTSGFQGSGIGYVVIQCIEQGGQNCFTSGIAGVPSSGWTYVPNGNDLATAAPAGYAPFHNVVAWNVVFNNRVTTAALSCSGGHTDGNGIIMDTFQDGVTNTLNYPYQTLVMGNVVYYNGGRGVHVFSASNVTVANNSVYNNGTDICIFRGGGVLGDLTKQNGSNNTFINNASKSVQQAAAGTGQNCSINAGGAGDTGNTYTNNVLSGPTCLFENDVTAFQCANNKCATDPLFMNATPGAAATTSGTPVGGAWNPGTGTNFAPQAVSPMIGYITPRPYIPLTDAGACSHTLTACP